MPDSAYALFKINHKGLLVFMCNWLKVFFNEKHERSA